MIICKRQDHLGDHLQMAGPSRWSFARGQILRMINYKRPVFLDDHLQEAGPSRWSLARGRSSSSCLKHDNDDDVGDGDDDTIDADHYGSVFWLKVSISACRGQLGGRNGNESGGRAVAAHPTEVSRIHKPAKSLQETYKNTQIQNKEIQNTTIKKFNRHAVATYHTKVSIIQKLQQQKKTSRFKVRTKINK